MKNKDFEILGAVPYYYEARKACHLLKEFPRDKKEPGTGPIPWDFNTYMELMPFIERIVEALPQKSILIPVPSHKGYATYTLDLALAVARQTLLRGKNAHVEDIVESAPRDLFYEQKKERIEPSFSFTFKKGKSLETLKTRREKFGYEIIAIDNVVDTGYTARTILSLLNATKIAAIGTNYKK